MTLVYSNNIETKLIGINEELEKIFTFENLKNDLYLTSNMVQNFVLIDSLSCTDPLYSPIEKALKFNWNLFNIEQKLFIYQLYYYYQINDDNLLEEFEDLNSELVGHNI